jgi:mannose-6-phosphate isomerase-like protein (cupin superfamily)
MQAMERPGIEVVKAAEETIAVIVRRDFRSDGIEFFTPSSFSQQLGYMRRPAGYEIPAHRHRRVGRTIDFTQEVLFVRSGRVTVDLYDSGGTPVLTTDLKAGDVILLAGGGHGFRMLEESEIVEVKQGPYAGVDDKEHF